MTLKDEKIQDNRIRATPEIGCRGTSSCAACRHAGQAHAVMPMQPAQIGEWWRYRQAATRVERGGEHVRSLTIHGEGGRRMGWDRSLRHSTDSFGRSWHHGF